MDIMPCIMKMKYEDHDLLESTEITVDPFVPNTGAYNDPTVCTLHDWARGLERLGILGLINMPYFGRLVEDNACAKQLLACFHGGYLWLHQPMPVTQELILQNMGLLVHGPDSSQYFRDKDNDKRLAAKLKKKFGMQHDK